MSNDKYPMNVCLRHKLFKIIIPSFLIFNLSFVIFVVGCGDLDGAVESLTVTPTSITVGINQSKSFSVIGRSISGVLVTVAPTWSVAGGVGSVSSNGLFTAGASAGEGSVVASYGGVSDSSTITVTDRCWLEGRVTGGRDPAGVENVLVALRDTSYSDRTDSSGNYSISNIPAGSYEVYSQEDHTIYQTSSQEVTLVSGETTTINYILVVRDGIPEVPTTTLFSF